MNITTSKFSNNKIKGVSRKWYRQSRKYQEWCYK
jgi:hypothetical protein